MLADISMFQKDGKWYKGNLHCHTTNSDGALQPKQMAEAFRKKGYHFLAMTEHERYTDLRKELDRDDFILLPGLEASATVHDTWEIPYEMKTHHFLGLLGTEQMQRNAKAGLYQHMEHIGKRMYFRKWDPVKAGQELVDELRDHGLFVTYNHPVWSRVTGADFLPLNGIWAMEIFNYASEHGDATGYDVIHYDQALRLEKGWKAYAADDNHSLADAFGGFVMVQALSLCHEDIVQALLDGNFYSSSGPEIYAYGIRDGKVYVECSPVVKIDFVAGNVVSAGGSVHPPQGEESICQASFELKGNESFVRIQCMDKYGRLAWTNPMTAQK